MHLWSDYLVMLFEDCDLWDALDEDSDVDDWEEDADEVEELEVLEEDLECFDWLSSILLSSPHSLLCLIWLICRSNLAILRFWSLITFLTSDSFFSDRAFKIGATFSEIV